jgi:hypothetical protein
MALEECVGNPVGYPDQTGQRFLRVLSILKLATSFGTFRNPDPRAPRRGAAFSPQPEG